MAKGTRPPSIAARLRQAVQDSGMTVNALAAAAGIAQPVLHRFLSGERDLTLRTVQKLVDYFGLELRPRRDR
jgi:plasmid maintenance system antidote protein VapI